MRPKTSPRGGAERLAVEDAEDVFEQVVLELLVVLRELVHQRLEVRSMAFIASTSAAPRFAPLAD